MARKDKMSGYGKEGDSPLRIITINVPRRHVEMIEKLVNEGIFPSRSETIRTFINEGLQKQLDFLIEVKEYLHLGECPEDKVRVPNGDGTYKEYSLIPRSS